MHMKDNVYSVRLVLYSSMDSVHEDVEPIKYTHNVSVSVLQAIQEKVINVLSLAKIVTETTR